MVSPSLVKAVCVNPEVVDKIWPTVAPLIRRAIDKTGFSEFEGIENDVLIGGSLVWLAWDGKDILAAAVTQITGEVCTIVGCGGSGLRQWQKLIGDLEDYARAEKCTRMRIIGRKGWARVLKTYWVPAIVLERRL